MKKTKSLDEENIKIKEENRELLERIQNLEFFMNARDAIPDEYSKNK